MASNTVLPEKSRQSSRISDLLPPVVLTYKLHRLINSVKEIKLITTYEEVLDGLGQYIASKKLYDPKNHKVCCKGDDLGSVLGTEEFLMSELNSLLPKLAVPLTKIPSYSDLCSVRKPDLTKASTSAALLSENPLKRKLDEGFEFDQRKMPTMKSVSPMVIHIPPSPTYCDLSDSIESIQGYETAYVKDTSDEFLSAENGEGDILVTEENFEIEYEVETDSSNSTSSEDSSDSDSEELVENIEEAIYKFLTQVFYKPKPDSDIEFFADASSEDDEQSDAEISESDLWSCPKCNIKNKPTVRYCLKCFQQRRNWLPDKPSNMKRKHRRSRIGLRDAKVKSFEANLPNHQQDSQEKFSCSPGVSCEIKESSSDLSSLKKESAGSCKTDPVDSLSVWPADSTSSSVKSPVSDVESLGLINGESSSSLCMESSDSPSMKSLGSSSMTSSSSMKSTISSYRDSADPSSMESSGPSSMELPCPSSMELSGPSSMESSGIYSMESSGPSSMEFSCPSSMEYTDSSHVEKLCMICCSEPVNASIIHGKFAHQISCYKCARKLQKGKKHCPVCRRAIDRVVIQVTM